MRSAVIGRTVATVARGQADDCCGKPCRGHPSLKPEISIERGHRYSSIRRYSIYKVVMGKCRYKKPRQGGWSAGASDARSPLVLLPRRRAAIRKGPHAVRKFQRQESVVLTRRLQRRRRRVQAYLR